MMLIWSVYSPQQQCLQRTFGVGGCGRRGGAGLSLSAPHFSSHMCAAKHRPEVWLRVFFVLVRGTTLG